MAGIYLHIPFCDTKCIYCDFYSITNHTKKTEFIYSLIKEIRSRAEQLRSKTFDTIFFGGGTPSLLSADEFNLIFDTLFSSYHITSDAEITIEANPGTLDKNKLIEFKHLPINRISFGVQSFIDKELKFLTRIHSSSQAIDSVKSAQETGFENINIDLIFAIPGQTLNSWKHNLETAVSLNTKHISAYSLIFEEETPLFEMHRNNKVQSADEELEREMYDYTMQFLPQNGFMQYEISNYAKQDYECKHNLNYWSHGEYIGFGPSSASFIDNYRWINVRDISKYIADIGAGKPAYNFIEHIDKDTSIYEHIFLGLRSTGINFNTFNNIYHMDFKDRYKDIIEILTRNKYASLNKDTLRLTSSGYAVCDEIVARYF